MISVLILFLRFSLLLVSFLRNDKNKVNLFRRYNNSLRRQQRLGPAQIDRHKPRNPLFYHRHAVKPVHPRHCDGVVRNDQVARIGIARHRVEQVTETLDIRIIERRIDQIGRASCRERVLMPV